MKQKKHIWIPFLGILAFYLVLYLTGIHTTCYFKAITGIPCPGCGMTRAYVHLLHGEIKGACYYHPLFFVPPIIILLLLIARLKHLPIPKWIWFLLLFLVVMTYIIRMLLLFPNTAPMDYYQGAILPRLWHYFLSLF